MPHFFLIKLFNVFIKKKSFLLKDNSDKKINKIPKKLSLICP